MSATRAEADNMKPDDRYIHIPMDLFHENSAYQCPNRVFIEMGDNSSTRRSVGSFANAKKASCTDMPSRPSKSVLASSGEIGVRHKEFNIESHALWNPAGSSLTVVNPKIMEQGESPRGQMSSYNNFVDVIDMVAEANEQCDGLDPTILPELRSSPCHIHHRQQPSTHLPVHRQQHQQLLYSTNYHGGHVPNSAMSIRSGSSGRYEALESQLQLERTRTFQQDMVAGRRQSYTRPVLPDEMASRDFVTSWLQHGSEPSGTNHFPNVVKQPAHHKIGRTPQNLGRRKPTLAPLEIISPKPAKATRQKVEQVRKSHFSE